MIVQVPVFGACDHADPYTETCEHCHGDTAYKGETSIEVSWLQGFLWNQLGISWGLPKLTDPFGCTYIGVLEHTLEKG